MSSGRVRLLAADVAQDYYYKSDRSRWLGPMDYPENVRSLYREVCAHVMEEVEKKSPEAKSDPQSPYYRPSKVSEAPTLDLTEVSETLYATRVFWPGGRSRFDPVERAIQRTFVEIGLERTLLDLLTLRFIALDHSRPVLRIVISSCYGLGFLILLIPTVSTFVLIARRLWGV